MSFNNLHPLPAFVWLMSAALITMFINNPFYLCISLVFSLAYLRMLTNAKELLKSASFSLVVIVAAAVINPLISHRGETPFLFINNNPITKEAVIYGIGTGLMLSAVIIWFKCFNIVVTSDKLTLIIGKPFPKIAVIISVAMRFVPLFISKGKQIRTSQKSLGIYQYTSLGNKIRGELSVISILITWAFENSVETSIMMQAKGYGLKKRTFYNRFRFRKVDFAVLLINILFCSIVICSEALGITEFLYYPSIKISVNICSYIIFTAFMAVPFALEIKEAFKWKYFLSKI